MDFGVPISVYLLINGRSFLFIVLMLCHCKMWTGFAFSVWVRSWLLAIVLYDKDPSKESVDSFSFLCNLLTHSSLNIFWYLFFWDLYIVCSIQLKSSWDILTMIWEYPFDWVSYKCIHVLLTISGFLFSLAVM